MARIARFVALLALVVLAVAGSAAPALAHEAPAGGVPLRDLGIAGVVGVVLALALAVLGWAHRTGRTRVLSWSATTAERISGIPGWAALPAGITGVSLLVAVFGFYWDVATHIDHGRDVGPFANTSHYFIIAGLLGIALAGVVSLLLGCEDDHPSAVRLGDRWHLPVGGLLLCLCGGVAVLTFPLDDMWHRIFGQDVTLWSPTHILMVGGASLCTLALWILLEEAQRSRRPTLRPEALPRVRDAAVAGAFLIGASTLQAEFDYGVPQFSLLYQPVMLAIAAGVALVPARVRLGPGGAFHAVGVYLLVRGALTLLVGPVLGHTTLHVPLYVAEAALVELVARWWNPQRQISFGAWAGLALGTIGLTTQWAWAAVAMPIPWPSAFLPEVVLLAVPAAVAGGLLGGFIGRGLTPPAQPRQAVSGWVLAAAAVAALSVLAYPLFEASPEGAVEVVLRDVEPPPQRSVEATVRLHPRDLADGAEYLNVTVWQGAEGSEATSFVEALQPVAAGTYRSSTPIPVHGEWKALVRLQKGRAVVAAPLYMPEDPAIAAEAIPAHPHIQRDLVPARQLLMREARAAPGWVSTSANAVLAAMAAAWVIATALGLRRLYHSGRGKRMRPPGGADDLPPASWFRERAAAANAGRVPPFLVERMTRPPQLPPSPPASRG